MSINKKSLETLNQTIREQPKAISVNNHKYSQSQIPEELMKLTSETQVIDKPSNFQGDLVDSQQKSQSHPQKALKCSWS